MIPQPQNEVHHVQKRWDFQTIKIIPILQEQPYISVYDHEEFIQYNEIKPDDPKYLDGQLKFETTREQLNIFNDNVDFGNSFYLNSKLDNTKNFIVSVTLYQRIGSFLSFGIIHEKHIGSGFKIYYGEPFGGNSNQIIKGNVHCDTNRSEIRKTLELKINISKGYWRIATVPDYSNISELNTETKIDSSKNYYLRFYFLSQSKLCINGIYEVSEFDNHF